MPLCHTCLSSGRRSDVVLDALWEETGQQKRSSRTDSFSAQALFVRPDVMLARIFVLLMNLQLSSW
jgi:IS4 transposase